MEVKCPTSNVSRDIGWWTVSVQQSSNWNFIGQMLDGKDLNCSLHRRYDSQTALFRLWKRPVSNVQHPYRRLDIGRCRPSTSYSARRRCRVSAPRRQQK
jgi:hypothetical protein